jgi:PPK2 family polyphosphate:nucleotide phosphotransferase
MAFHHRFDHRKFRVSDKGKLRLAKVSTDSGPELVDKDHAAQAMAADLQVLQESQNRLYAEGRRGLLIILQGMDTCGKDGTIRHVISGVNPQGCRVHSFRAPTSEELQHHFLWRPMRFLPEKGMMAIFNRSYYEEVLVVRVHPEYLEPQRLPPYKKLADLWERRFEEIRQFEKVVTDQGTSIIKFYLHISAKEQKQRLLERLREPQKGWKFNERDLEERKLWKKYEESAEAMMVATSTKHAPWYLIPADDKWYARAAIADIISSKLTSMDLQYPTVSKDREKLFEKLAENLENEPSNP